MEKNDNKHINDLPNLLIQNSCKSSSLSSRRTFRKSSSTGSIRKFFNSKKNSIPSSTLLKSTSEEKDLVVIGCGKNKANNLFKKAPNIKKNFRNKFVSPSNSNRAMREEEEEESKIIEKERPLVLPLEAARTIYKELYRQKLKFYEHIKNSKYRRPMPSTSLPKTQKPIDNSATSHLLDRKIINNVPVILPLYLSYKNNYNSISERIRHEKLIETFSKLKTYITKDPDNEIDIIKEFMIKNYIVDPQCFELEKINNFYNFLKKPFKFSPQKTVQDIIYEALNYSPTDEDLRQTMIKANEKTTDFIDDHEEKEDVHHSKETKKSPSEKKDTGYKFINVDEEKYYKNIKKNYKPKEMEELVKDLESELETIHREKMEIIEKNDKIWNSSVEQGEIELEDTNVYVPNLSLSCEGINSKILKRLKEKREMISRKINKQNRIKEINQRLYYGCILKDQETDIDEIKRRNKLTEYIILERTKKKIALEREKERLNINKNII